jgi:hypothetical protein
MSKPLVLVAQLGARRHYLVPISLHAGGHLERFCTDVYFGRRPWLDPIAARVLGSRSRGFKARCHPSLPTSVVSDFPALSIAGRRPRGSQCRRWIDTGRSFGVSVVRTGFGRADTVVAFSSAALEIFEAARAAGLQTILDHATAPRDVEMAAVAQEEERFPGWAPGGAMSDPGLGAYAERQQRERALADRILCGSSFVTATLTADDATDPSRLRTVPLGVAPSVWNAGSNLRQHQGSLRVLFVGNEGLRKGLGYLIEAVKLLKSRHVRFRVAGNPGFSPLGRRALDAVCEECRPVAREEMSLWYEWADVVVLPSVSDTFGLVILEAMAAGVPVVASAASGGPDVIRDGVDGWVVPPRDAVAIAARLDELAASPGLARQIGDAARRRAEAFGVEAYTSRLLEAIAS